MKKEILYTTALDENGLLIFIDDAEKKNEYFCPSCGQKFILRKSGKTGKGHRRPHFAHNELQPNCTPEGVLHSSFKKLTIEFLEKYISENKPLKLTWNCRFCDGSYSGNLLAKAKTVKEEYTVGNCRPDIALLDKSGNVIAAIEIVVTHKPEEQVLQYYNDNGIVLIQINLLSEEDLKNIGEKLSKPDIVDLCFVHQCLGYKSTKLEREVVSDKIRCKRCQKEIFRFYISIGSVFGICRSHNFTQEEILRVKSEKPNVKVNIKKSNELPFQYPIMQCGCMKIHYRRYKESGYYMTKNGNFRKKRRF
ncbi:competence protein CoiA family protein [Culturomica sp.]|uniref:competence protein CoiA family protein n=1 Tax=Culturomica sp. TaxID=1926652 RepID=UPI000E9DE96A|nr:competence protein CoiA family protein [Culturomica sp.]HBO27780.1 hypothetical protein [Culturomica sp.]